MESISTFLAVSGLFLDVIGFTILMFELGAAQTTEFRGLSSDYAACILQLKKKLSVFLHNLRQELEARQPNKSKAFKAFRAVTQVYFSKRATHENYVAALEEGGLSKGDIEALNLDAEMALSLEQALEAWEALNTGIGTQLTAIEWEIFSSNYRIPSQFNGEVVIEWLLQESAEDELRWFTDLNARFRVLRNRNLQLLRRRTRFLSGAFLVIFGFIGQLVGAWLA